MTKTALLAPVLVQVALTFVLLFWMGSARVRALRAGQLKVKDIALGQSAWPERITQIGNCYHNQFQLPVLFYAGVGFAMLTGQVGGEFVALAWAFVVSRVLHAMVHTSSNNVPRRFYAFVIGAVVLMALWIDLGVRLLLMEGH